MIVNVDQIVEQQQYMFETLWSKAIPFEQRIREIEEGGQPVGTRILEDQDQIINEIRRFNNEIVVSISDTGPGIDSEILPRLFTKFATKSAKVGTGLGLFISKSIIEAHGGKIWGKIIILKAKELPLDLAYLFIMRSLKLAASLLRFVLCCG